MKVLFSALHLAHFRNFESVVRELARRGHQVHLTGDEPESLGGRALAARLAAEVPGVTWGESPAPEAEPWFDTARRLREGLDYARAAGRRYAAFPKLRLRAAERAPRLVRWLAGVPAAGPAAAVALLTRIERLWPVSEAVAARLREAAPDVVVLASLTSSRSHQIDQLKAARALGLPVAAAIMSWDHLSSKALLHLAPDLVLVWNDLQRREAVEMHGLPADRVVRTGAQCYDQWFARRPSRDAAAFAARVGLRSDRPFVLYVCSALTPSPDPPEPDLVRRWIGTLRASADPALAGLGVLVRPHPERLKEWGDDRLADLDNVAFHGGNPIDDAAKDDYFDALWHSRAVVGLVTSAFLEAAIVGRPVLTFTLPEYRLHQEGMIHFQYLTSVAGGLMRVAPDLPAHAAQLREALALEGARDERNRRFVEAFVRPAGLDTPATPAFVDALEQLAREGPRGDAALPARPVGQRLAVALAARGRTGLLRRLLNDRREDGWDRQRAGEADARARREDARLAHREEKIRAHARHTRRESVRRLVKVARSRTRMLRHRAAMLGYRLLVAANLRRDVPRAGGK